MTDRSQLSTAVGRRVRELRLEASIPLARLASQAGIRSSDLQGIEQGRGRPSVDTLSKLARGLRVSVIQLVKTAEVAPPPVAGTSSGSAPLGELDRIGRAIAELPATVGDKLEAADAAATRHALTICGGNQTAAARLLGIERKAITRRWEKARRAQRRKG